MKKTRNYKGVEITAREFGGYEMKNINGETVIFGTLKCAKEYVDRCQMQEKKNDNR